MVRTIVQRMLRFFAVMRLTRDRPEVVAVTGSVGKTTTKEAIFSVLTKALGDRVFRSAGNMNTEEGLPLAILGFDVVPTRWQYAAILLNAAFRAIFGHGRMNPIFVLELSAEKPGDIQYLTEIIRPWLKVGVITTIGPIHLNPGQFSSVAAIEGEKGKLIEVLPPDGWAVLNRTNPATKRMAKRTKAKIVWFTDKGIDTHAEIAKAVGKIYGMDKKDIDAALKTFQRPYGRLNELAGVKGSVVIDDSYNANPMSTQEALLVLEKRGLSGHPSTEAQAFEALRSLQALERGGSERSRMSQGRRIAVLGDMLELGERERLFHQQIGKFAKTKADIIVGVGMRARWYNPTYHFATPLEAASFLKKFVHAGDTLLIKGSQSMRMELVSEVLLASPEDSDKLPRQTPAWKAKTFVQP